MADTAGRTAPAWTGGAVAGLVAAVLVGIGIWALDQPVIETHVPEAVGTGGALVGLMVLAAIGVVLGVVYAALGRLEPVGRAIRRPRTGGVVGLAYGLATWMVAIVVVPIAIGEGVDAIGEVAVTARAAVAFALLGTLIGTGYPLWHRLRER
ncbi:MAG: histidine kinase [Halobacteriota archaeon]